MNSRLGIERLEDRLVMATLDLTAGVLSYIAGVGVSNNLTLSTDGTTETLNDPSETISLTGGAAPAGFTVSVDGHTATGPDSAVSSIVLNTMDSTDTINIQSTVKPVSVTPTNNATGSQAVNLGNSSHGVQDITGALTINNDSSSKTTVVADDSTNTVSARGVSLTGQTINGLTPSTITLTAGALSTLSIFAGTQNNSFVFNSTLAPATTLNAGPALAGGETVHELDPGNSLSITSKSLVTVGFGVGLANIQGAC